MTTRPRTHTRKTRSWSKSVTEQSHAMDLEPGVFRKSSARAVAQSVKHSAEHSHTRKSTPFRSAMSMLNLYVNRAGGNLPDSERDKLARAKEELRKLFKRPPRAANANPHRAQHQERRHS